MLFRILENAKPGDAVPPLPKDGGEASIANLDKCRYANGSTPTAEIRLNLQKTMQRHAAVFRRGDLLKVGLTLLQSNLNDFHYLGGR